MFLNMTKLEKVMKDSYKVGNLRIGAIDEGVYISNGIFVVWISRHYLSNSMKGLIVKYAGEVPEEEGKGLLLTQGGPPQIEYPVNPTFDLPEVFHRPHAEVERTNVSCDSFELLQEVETKKIHMVSQKLLGLIDSRIIASENGETPLAPPVSINGMRAVLFRNNTGMLLLVEMDADPSRVGVKKLIQCAETISISERRGE